ncbi:hypothetical protein BDZ94DRAFT_1305645 [Collybia nuda]|uniref:Zn(2)-C6 fungal-type domain-containing protein n=1 Tax=Collybia nuda TaxID=64659 RepID=A0A9P5YE16_9AGAR|nr:hypothetical protein BDZ94DRAFT_1305645 [Collybia nuda]
MSGVNSYKRSLLGESSGVPNRSPSSNSTVLNHEEVPSKRAPNKAARRIRGEIACAECRRLKIKCDKIVPCSTCVKRGCAALCPNGTIPPGEGSRFVLAATDHLRRKMTKMEARMHSLEDALAIVQANSSSRPHPLLSAPDDDEDDEDEEPILKPVVEDCESTALSEALGTLHMGDHGTSRFFGPSGGSESLLLKAKDIEAQTPWKTTRPLLEELDPSYLPSEINHCYQCFPFPPGILSTPVQSMIESFLPPMDRAISLCDTFLEHLSWMFHIVSRQQLVNELIPVVYKQINVTYGPHDLALMLIVLGIGSLVDLNLQPYNLEAQHYYRLARATLSLQPVLGEQSVVTIKVANPPLLNHEHRVDAGRQVLHLMSIYNGMSGKESNLEQSYALLDLASQVALRIGFHIDPSLWGFEGKEAYERRVYFWNLMSAVLWQSLVTGRPPSLLTTYIDCRIPTAEDEQLYQRGEVPLGFGIWGFRASVECLIPLVKTTLGVKPPSYPAILDLDRQIRNFTLPQSDDPLDDRTAISMRIFVRSHYQDLLLLFLHRGFFAQAMSENPRNPLEATCGQSVLAAYSSACVVLEDTKMQFLKKPLLCARVWRIWSLAFSAAVIVGTVATRGIHLGLNPPAFEEFESSCAMFRSAAETSSRAARAMPILEIMLQKAFRAREHFHERREPIPSETQHDDELSIFGGKTRLVNPQQFPVSPFMAPGVPQLKSALPARNQTAFAHEQFPGHLQQITASENHARSSSNYLDNLQATFADLSGGWDGLFHEVPGPSYGLSTNTNPTYPVQQSGNGIMLDDRWSSFMHNYSILAESGQPANHHRTM